MSLEYRAHFDARIEFANGGGLTAEAFRLDLPSADVDEADGRPAARAAPGARARRLGDARRTSRSSKSSTAGRAACDAAPGRRRPHVASSISATSSARVSITYPGLPAPTITPHLTREASREKYAPGTEFAMDIITMIGNTGTYLDSPFHRYGDGADLAGLDLATLVDLPAEVFHLHATPATRGIPAEVFFDRDLRGAAVLLHTGWDAHFGTPAYGSGAPFLTAAGARHLVEQGVALVGIDSLNIDDTESGGERPAHTRAARRRHPRRRAPPRPRAAAAARCAVHRRPACGPRLRHLPGAGLRDPAAGRDA